MSSPQPPPPPPGQFSGGGPPAAAPGPGQPSYDAGAGQQPQQPAPWMPPNAGSTPNAERYLLEADALRRRQLRSALLHGSSRTWRDNRRIWPGVIAGAVVVGVILATFAVLKAVKTYNDQQDQEELEQQQQSAYALVLPAGVEV